MNKGRKTITLPSGGTCVVRKLAESDFIAAGQTVLLLNLIDPERRRKKAVEVDEEKAFQALVDLHNVMLTSCCGRITFPDKTVAKIVQKPFDECTDAEITIEELAQPDAAAIIQAVKELSGMTKEAVQAARSFPEAAESSHRPASAGEELPGSADRAAQP